MSVTIEGLKEEKSYLTRERNKYGDITREPYKVVLKRKVNIVSGLPRIGHFLIDFTLLYCAYFFVGFVLQFSYPNSNFLNSKLFSYLLFWGLWVAYYFTFEKILQRTIGKFATGSVVIDQHAKEPSTGQLIARSFARLVPFEAFSCLADRGWHDKWSKTYVVTEQERDELQRLLNKHEGNILSNSEDLLD